MTQSAKVIDVTRSFIPVDPNAFPETLHGTGKEDYPEKSASVVPYEGYNFLPTPYGYKSYFGTTASIGIDALTSRIDKVLIIQTDTFENILVALCEDGIWTKRGDTAGAWTQEVTLTIPDAGTHYDWSYCYIGKTVYFYRAGDTSYYEFRGDVGVFPVGTVASAVTGLAVVQRLYAGAALAAGTYSVQVAYKSIDGQISLPSGAVNSVMASVGHLTINWTRLATAANGYRVYVTIGGVTKYKDVAQGAGATISLEYYGYNTTAITLPDPTVVTKPRYSASKITPNFLNMAGQHGIFKAGGRLGFWDSENSIAWSSFDDHADFEPSVTTLAGSAIFNEVRGRIVNIRSHGEGFIVYSTQSIVWIRQVVEATFQWDPLVIISGSGIAYTEECTSGIPDTTHFAWTSIGCYKIESGKAEIIVPEVTHYLKESKDPIFLRIMEGRFLVFGIIDANYINGLTQFSVNNVPPLVYTFPGGTTFTDYIAGVTLEGTTVCGVASALNSGDPTDVQAAGEASRVAAASPAKAPNTKYTPVWTAYFSKGILSTDDIGWTNAPVATLMPDGTDGNMCPTAASGGKVSQLSTSTAGKVAVTGAEAYVDGAWTIERFIAVQEAIWTAEDNNRKAFLSVISNRTATKTVVTPNAVACAIVAPTHEEATIAQYVTDASGRLFNATPCSVSYTRVVTGTSDLVRVRSQSVVCDVIAAEQIPPSSISYSRPVTNAALPSNGTTISGSDPVSVCPDAHIPITTFGTQGDLRCNYGIENTLNVITANVTCPAGYTVDKSGGLAIACRRAASTTKTDTVNAYNKLVNQAISTIGDSAHLIMTGYRYTDINGVARTVAAASACALPDTTPPTDSGGGYTKPPIDSNGGVCSIPFETVTLPAIQANPIVWPDTTVVLPAGSFLLQDGSIGPIYPTFEGALVYDLQLKKWGKMKLQYKQLLDYAPINDSSGSIIPYETFGLSSGVMKADGKIYLFDSYPLDSYIKWGKIGYYRLGMTDQEEVILHMRTRGTGILETETSLDGRNPEVMLRMSESFTGATEVTLGGGYSGRWHNVIVRGNYDIQYLEYRGFQSGKR